MKKLPPKPLGAFSRRRINRAAALLRQAGWNPIPPEEYLIDLEEEFLTLWERVRPWTMTSVERAYGLWQAAVRIAETGLPGDLGECGVWKGGSCMLMALTLLSRGAEERKLWLFDTFAGMPEPGPEDVIAWNNLPVEERNRRERDRGRVPFAGWDIPAEEVRENLLSTGYPPENLRLVCGPVEETLRGKGPLPEKLCLLRLDTDFYASTRTELEVLYPRLVPGGFLILDDYGHFKGARQAVDEYFASFPGSAAQPPFLHRLDYTGRLGIKPGQFRTTSDHAGG
jgi:hypothetical protein